MVVLGLSNLCFKSSAFCIIEECLPELDAPFLSSLCMFPYFISFKTFSLILCQSENLSSGKLTFLCSKKNTLLGLNFAGIILRGWLYPRNLNISQVFNFADSLLSNFSRVSMMATPNL